MLKEILVRAQKERTVEKVSTVLENSYININRMMLEIMSVNGASCEASESGIQTGMEARRCEETQGEESYLQVKERGLEQTLPHSHRKEPTVPIS